MKTKLAMAVVAAIAVISVVSVSAYTTNSNPLSASSADLPPGALAMYGHLEMTVTDSSGNVKQYIQTDNEITREGTNCIVQKLFRTDFFGGGAVSGCLGDPGVFDTIYVGTADPAGANNTAQVSFITNATDLLANPVEDTDVILTNNTSGTGAEALISATFTNQGSGSDTIQQAALINATSAEDSGLTQAQLMAYREFTGITLNADDQLTINWTITVPNDST